MEVQWAIDFSTKENILFRLRADARDSRWLVFVFESGTVVAPIKP
jgi:hypothetical protein